MKNLVLSLRKAAFLGLLFLLRAQAFANTYTVTIFNDNGASPEANGHPGGHENPSADNPGVGLNL